MVTRLIPPTAFTQQFFDMDFESYQYLLDDLIDGDHPATCDLPVVPIEGFDLDALDRIYQYCRSVCSGDFKTVKSQIMYSDWCFQPRSQGWTEIVIKAQPMSMKGRDSNLDYNLEADADNHLVELCRQLFPDWWDRFFSLKIMKMAPDGWANPHRDIYVDNFRLCNFWMPLHDFSTTLKVFPMGWLAHRLGNMYLFNQRRFPHAVKNSEQEDRIVLIGKFYQDLVPQQIVEQFLINKKKHLQQWQ